YVFGEFVLYTFLCYVIPVICSRYFSLDLRGELKLGQAFIIACVMRFFYFIVFSTGYYYFLSYKKAQEEKLALQKQYYEAEMENQRLHNLALQMENSWLRSQINPHFLNNTLNVIYNNCRKVAPVAAEGTLVLSGV